MEWLDKAVKRFPKILCIPREAVLCSRNSEETLFHSSLEILGNSNQGFSLNAKHPKQIKINFNFSFNFDLIIIIIPVFNV